MVACPSPVLHLPSVYALPAVRSVSLLALLASTCCVCSAQTAFPQRPLDRAQILIWIDFGEEGNRVEQLIGRAGIGFQASPDYLSLLKDVGGDSKLLDAIIRAKQTTTSGVGMSDTVFGQLVSCLKMASKKQYDAAEKACKAATSEEPGVTYFAFGNIELKQGKYDAALEAFRAAEKADPSVPDSHNYAGLVLQSKHDATGAEKEYQQAIQLDAAYDTPHNNLADMALEKNDVKTAERELREALRINPNSGSAHNNLAAVYFKQKKYADVLSEMRKAAEVEPNDPFRHAKLGEFLEATGDHAGAATEYRSAIVLAPGVERYHFGLLKSLTIEYDLKAMQAESVALENGFPSDTRYKDSCSLIHKAAKSPAPESIAGAEQKVGSTTDATSVSMFEIPREYLVSGASLAVARKLEELKPEGFAEVQVKAAAGDAEAEMLVCGAYRRGMFGPKDDSKALPWCIKAAQQGNLAAEDNLGSMYLFGRGTAQDSKQAMGWLQKAVAQGSEPSMCNLASMYANGIGVPQDYAMAMKLYQQAVDHGSTTAQTDIGIMYLMGQGVPKDPNQALAWIHKSTDAGYSYADFLLGLFYQKGFAVKRSYKDSLEWLKKAADQNFAPAETALGIMYANGVGVSRDYNEAVKWYEKSAELGDAAGEYGLGVRYFQGMGWSATTPRLQSGLPKPPSRGWRRSLQSGDSE
jgi:uncharacterized protein